MNNINISNRASRKRKLRYGGASIIFTAVFVAVIVLANIALTALADKYLWYFDMTKTELYTVSDASKLLLADLENEDDRHIDIVFFADADELEGSLYMRPVYNCAREYEKEFDFIGIKYIDRLANPTAVNKYKMTAATAISDSSVVVDNGSDYRVYSLNAFYKVSSETNNPVAFDGEMKFTSAILQLMYDNPIAYFTVGHGEAFDNSILASLFDEAGFDVRKIDLTSEDIDPAARVVIIYNPTYDFIGDTGKMNEIDKLDKFLDSYGNLMVFMNPEALAKQEMPELTEYLAEWGISFGKSYINDKSNSVDTDGYALIAQYPTEGLGASLHAPLRALETPPKTIMYAAGAVNILWDEKDMRNVSTVLNTSKSAVEVSDKPTAGQFNLMTLSRETTIYNNVTYYSYVLAANNVQFENFLTNTSYGNRDIMYSMMKVMGKEKVPADIDFKMLEDEGLDISTSEANRISLMLVIIPPAAVLAIGAFVLLRRRHL